MLWLLVGDLVIGLASFVLIRWRHRQPAVVGVVLGLFSFVSTASAGPSSWVIGSIAAHRRWRLLSVVVPLSVLGGVVQERIGVTQDTLPLWASIAFGLLIAGILVATGYAMSSQRQLVDSYRDRALTAEREQLARVAQARAAERTRIAREMHDVLAHRISLVAMNAGTLSAWRTRCLQPPDARPTGSDDGLLIAVRNAAPVGSTPGPGLPASGLGLIGLAERAALAGGRISHGVDPTGGYAVRAWIPWTS